MGVELFPLLQYNFADIESEILLYGQQFGLHNFFTGLTVWLFSAEADQDRMSHWFFKESSRNQKVKTFSLVKFFQFKDKTNTEIIHHKNQS